MTLFNRNLLAVALAIAVSPAFAADRAMSLLPPQSRDVVATGLVAAKTTASADIERAPVAFAWALDASPLSAPQPYAQESREYWTNVEAKALRGGFTIQTTAPGAVIRLSPENTSQAKSLDPLQIAIRVGGQTYARGTAFASASNAAELKAAGAPFADGTVAFKLKPELGAGAIDIVMADARSGYLVHVFEPDSGERLHLATDRAVLAGGGAITVNVDYASASSRTLGRVGGVISAPNGMLTELAFTRTGNGRWQATARPDVVAGAGAGLWEVHTFATTSDGAVQRDAKTAFNAAPATARLDGRAIVADAKGANAGVNVTFGVEVASASRYNVSAVLYATDARGTLVPAAIAHAATWLGAGAQSLALRFGDELVAARGLGAPYELRDLTLSNQANLGVMEQRERALRIER